MNNTTKGIITLAIVILLSVGIYFAVSGTGNQETSQTDTTNTPSSSVNETSGTSQLTELPTLQPAQEVGSYLPYSEETLANADGNVVLFFNADWCPTCQALRSNLEESRLQFPSDLTIIYADFDDETTLRQEYGVTTQHTLLKLDSSGAEVARDVGQIFTLEDVVEFSES